MRKRITSLQGIRLIAFFGVFISHSNIDQLSSGGAWGVSVFLILSGFLMIYSYYDTNKLTTSTIKENLQFGVKKIGRLYYLHIAMLLVSIPFQQSANTIASESTCLASKVILNTSLLQSWIPKKDVFFSLNAVSWYLSDLLFLYVMFPCVLRLMNHYKGINSAVRILIITYCTQCISAYLAYCLQLSYSLNDNFILWFVYVFPPIRFIDFFIGCNLGYIFIKFKKPHNNIGIFTALEVSILLFIIIQLYFYTESITIPSITNSNIFLSNWWGFSMIWTISSGALVFVFAFGKGVISFILSKESIQFLAYLSAYAFLIHQMIYRYLEFIERKLSINMHPIINIIICFILTFIGSYLWDIIIIKKMSFIQNRGNSNE
jgi:peptidoglycan/LPS O-acetylase OafA/YrhL